MGREPLPVPQGERVKRWAALWLVFSSSAWAALPTPPPTREAAGRILRLQGTAVGKATFLGVKVYRGALYAVEPLRTPAALRDAAPPVRFDFTFLRRIDPKTNAKAWSYYFREFSEHRYPRRDEDVTAFKSALGRLERGTVQTVELLDGETRFYEGGRLLRVIPGRDFQKAFLSIWASDRPAQGAIRRGFLGGAAH